MPNGPLPPDLVQTIAEIAGVVGAWCPSLSPDGTNRLRHRPFRAARAWRSRTWTRPVTGPTRCRGGVTVRDQEVVSVAWSPDGRWLAYLVSPERPYPRRTARDPPGRQ